MMTTDTTNIDVNLTETPGGRLYRTAQKNRRSIGYGVVVTIACVVLAIALSVTLTDGGEKKAPNSLASATTPTPPPPTTTSSEGPLSILLETLPRSTVESIQSPDSTTPQAQAFEWLDAHPEVEEMEESRKMQLFALATFYYAMEGLSWPSTNGVNQWMQYGIPECEWARCNEDGAVTSLAVNHLNLFQEGLLPRVPPEISLLTELASLSLSNNSIASPLRSFLPAEIYQIDTLSKLALDQNSLFGSLPSELNLMTNLKQLFLWKNQLQGSFGGVYDLTGLEQLDMSHNSFTGTLHSDIGKMASLSLLRLHENKISGRIPSELGLLTQLSDLFLRENVGLSGTLPTELGHLTDLVFFNLGKCALSGTIPAEYAKLSKLADRSIWLEENKLSGTIPTTIGSWTNLGLLLFNGNDFSGTIPSEIGLLNGLEEISLYENELRGSLPSELGLLTDTTIGLARLYLYSNGLTGEIPTELGELVGSVNGMRLQNNSFVGTVPEELCALGQVRNANDWWEQGLLFDCSSTLCGCSWCPCNY